MIANDIKLDYFLWICSLVIAENEFSNVSYDNLLMFLFSTPYHPEYENDVNREHDGYSFRYRYFPDARGYDYDYVQENLDIGPCNMLEMLVAFSYRIEDDIMSDETQGNRTGQWFWSMIVSLGLGQMDDENFDPIHCNYVMDRFMSHNYQPNGEGGLFTFNYNQEDMRLQPLWQQAMWYLNENFDFSSWIGGSM